MNKKTVLAIAVMVVGVVLLVFRGFHYTTREEFLKIGSLRATAETRKGFDVHPAVGGVVLACGVTLFLFARRVR